MTKTIPQLDSGAGLTGDELFEMSQGGSSFKTTLLPIEEVTSGAAPINLDPSYRIHLVTSGGTGGVEVVNMPLLPLGPGEENNLRVNERHLVIFQTQTHVDDVLHVTANETDSLYIMDDAGNTLGSATDDVLVITFETGSVCLWWQTYNWAWDNSNPNSDTTVAGAKSYVPSAASQLRPGSTGYLSGTLSGDDTTLEWSNSPIPGTQSAWVTGASPTEISPLGTLILLTSGGTAGTEEVSLADPDANEIGCRINLFFNVQTDPSDVISIDVANISDYYGNPIDSLTVEDTAAQIVLEAFSNNVDWESNYWRIYSNYGWLVNGEPGAGGYPLHLEVEGIYDPGNLATLTGVTTTLACAGAVVGNHCTASFSNNLEDVILFAWVSAADVVSVRFFNSGSGSKDLGSGTLEVYVQKG